MEAHEKDGKKMERKKKVERGGKSDKSEVRTVKVYFNQTTTHADPCVLTTQQLVLFRHGIIIPLDIKFFEHTNSVTLS